MEQKIKFCTTPEGINLAYSIVGKGPALIIPPAWISNIKLDWEIPKGRAFFEKLASHHSLIRYDRHGCGLSDRERKVFTLEKEVRDLEAIVSNLALQRLALFGYSQSGPISIAYATKHPERISHLILYGTFARGIETRPRDLAASLRSLVKASWGLGSRTLANRFIPGGDKTEHEFFAKYQREAATSEMAVQLMDLIDKLDVSDLLSQITTPTLVIHRNEDQPVPVRFGRQLAVSITNARLVLLEGKDHVPWLGNSEEIVRAVTDFIDPESTVSTEIPVNKSLKKKDFERKLAAILSADVEGYSLLMSQNEEQTVRTLTGYRKVISDVVQQYRGRVVDSPGDNILAEFRSVVDAVNCAIDIQTQLAERNTELRDNRKMKFRIGVNVGDVIEEEGRIYGDGVNIAARVESMAEAGGICISGRAYDQVANKLDLGYENLGEHQVKNISTPIRIFRITVGLSEGTA